MQRVGMAKKQTNIPGVFCVKYSHKNPLSDTPEATTGQTEEQGGKGGWFDDLVEALRIASQNLEKQPTPEELRTRLRELGKAVLRPEYGDTAVERLRDTKLGRVISSFTIEEMVNGEWQPVDPGKLRVARTLLEQNTEKPRLR
jgi:hypothetical protein